MAAAAAILEMATSLATQFAQKHRLGRARSQSSTRLFAGSGFSFRLTAAAFADVACGLQSWLIGSVPLSRKLPL